MLRVADRAFFAFALDPQRETRNAQHPIFHEAINSSLQDSKLISILADSSLICCQSSDKPTECINLPSSNKLN
jgi:hypothetical protein